MNTEEPHTIELFDMAISHMTLAEVFDCVQRHIGTGAPGYIVTPNVNHVCLYHRDPEFTLAYDGAMLHIPDGVPILWTARILGSPLPQKLSGSDMVPWLCEFAAREGHSVFFLGGTPGTAEKTAEIMCDRYPNLKVAGVNCPEKGFEKDPEAMARLTEELKKAKPDVCFVALGSPKQEVWISQHYQALNIPICIGVGGTFDFVSGRVKRAPGWLQHIGLEWLWRLCMEPRRLWRRYLYDDLVFFRLLFGEFTKRWRNGAAAPDKGGDMRDE